MHCFGHADWRQEMESNRIMQTSSSEVSVSEVYVRSISTVKMDWKRLSNATRWYERIHRQLYLAGHAVRTDYWADTQATLPGWPCSKNWLLVSETTIPHNFKFYGKFFLHLNSENDVYNVHMKPCISISNRMAASGHVTKTCNAICVKL